MKYFHTEPVLSQFSDGENPLHSWEIFSHDEKKFHRCEIVSHVRNGCDSNQSINQSNIISIVPVPPAKPGSTSMVLGVAMCVVTITGDADGPKPAIRPMPVVTRQSVSSMIMNYNIPLLCLPCFVFI